MKNAKMAMRGVFLKKRFSTLKNQAPGFFRNATPRVLSKYRAAVISKKIGIECFKNLYTAGSGKGGRARGHDG
jgi:hypothetical protein